MPRVRIEDGTILNFDAPPSQEEIEEAVQQLHPSSPSFSPAQRITATLGGVALNPFLQAARKGTSLIPERFLEPALGTAGAVVGSQIPVPFSATLGAMGGTALGGTLAGLRHGSLPEAPLWRDVGLAGAGTLGGSAAGKVLGKAAQAIRGVPFFLSKANRLELAQEARSALGESTQRAGRTLQSQLGKIPGTVDLSQELAQLSETMGNQPGVQDLVENGITKAERLGDSTLFDALTNPAKAQALNAQEVQQILATLKQSRAVARTMSQAGRMAGQSGKFLTQTPDEVMTVLNHENAILSKASQALPSSFGQERQAFATVARGQRELTPYFSKRSFLQHVARGFPEELEPVIQTTLPPKIAQRVLAPSVARSLGETIVKTAAGGLTLGTLWKLFQHGQTNSGGGDVSP